MHFYRSPRRLATVCSHLFILMIFLGQLGSVGFGQDWPADRAPQELKIATWNLEWFFDDFKANNRSDVAKEQSAPSRDEWEWRVGNFAAAIAKFEPTILAVQEIEDRGVMQNLTKVLKVLPRCIHRRV
jgi:hypothetical protein